MKRLMNALHLERVQICRKCAAKMLDIPEILEHPLTFCRKTFVSGCRAAQEVQCYNLDVLETGSERSSGPAWAT